MLRGRVTFSVFGYRNAVRRSRGLLVALVIARLLAPWNLDAAEADDLDDARGWHPLVWHAPTAHASGWTAPSSGGMAHAAPPADADPWPAEVVVGDGNAAPWQEYSVGGDATRRSWLVYSSATLSPFGDLWSDGVRVRVSGAFGRYDYVGGRGKLPVDTQFKGEVSVIDGLVGYMLRLGPLTAKAFAGVSAVSHDISPEDPLASSGRKIGGKGVLELWLDLGDIAWSSLDMSFTNAHQTYAVRARDGLRVTRELSLGLESGLNGSAGFRADGRRTGWLDPTHRDVRLGGFVRYDWSGGEASISGGLSTDLGQRRDPYGTANFMLRY